MSFKPGVKAATAAITHVDWRLTPPSPSRSLDRTNDASLHSFAKPPHYHESLFCSAETTNLNSSINGRLQCQKLSPALENDEDEDEDEDEFLNPDFSGVKDAQQTILSYELEAGFYEEDHGTEGCEQLLSRTTLEDDDNNGQPPPYDLSPAGRRTSSSLLPSDKITTRAATPLPSPAPKLLTSATITGLSPGSYVNTLTKNARSSPLKQKALNAAASSFVPHIHVVSFPTSSPSPELDLNKKIDDRSTPTTTSGFSFPSLDLKSPTPSLKKDGDGFYLAPEALTKPSSETHRARTPSSRRHSSIMLPPFLGEHVRERKVSRTRSIVDSIRSAEQAAIASKAAAAVAASITSAKTSSFSSFSSVTQATNPRANFVPTPPGSVFSSPELSVFRPRLTRSGSFDDDVDSASSPPTSPEARPEEEDGWLRTAKNIHGDPIKAKRTRELFSALSRNRAESFDQFSAVKDVRRKVLSLAQAQAQAKAQAQVPAIVAHKVEATIYNDLNPNSNTATTKDGWLAPTSRMDCSRVKSPIPSNSSFYPQMAPNKCSPFRLGPGPYTNVMLVQMQLQLQAQMRQLMQARAAGGFVHGAASASGGGVPNTVGGRPGLLETGGGYARVRQMSESGVVSPELRKNRLR